MEGEPFSQELPDHLVEMIIARMPFPSIFKARTLSKAWLARFSSIKSDEGDGNLAAMCPIAAAKFQKLVSEMSQTWEISGPICISYDHDECNADRIACRPTYDKCYAYNRELKTWQIIPSISFVKGRSPSIDRDRLTIDGALVFMPGDDSGGLRKWSSLGELYLANILTRKCSLLPSRLRLDQEQEILLSKIVTNTTLDTFKVVLLVQTYQWHYDDFNEGTPHTELWVQIFDSMSYSWRNKKLVGSDLGAWSPRSAVYLNGSLYMVAGRRATRLVQFDMEEETLTVLSIGDEDAIHGKVSEFVEQLVVCDGNLFVICSKRSTTLGSDLYIRVVKVDLNLGKLSVVAEGPPKTFNLKSFAGDSQPVAHGGCIYFWEETSPGSCSSYRNCFRYKQETAGENSGGQMPVYNVRENTWSCIPSCPDGFYTGCCFQPGLNPFLAV